ncbi:alpha/beta hydrolase [Parafrigoribacterium soli]|uniref:alpha/beta hydrolase n=1 Tax=Parafrigoribacterium soli TaxID=3144663 RepID=UPI0032F05DE7
MVSASVPVLPETLASVAGLTLGAAAPQSATGDGINTVFPWAIPTSVMGTPAGNSGMIVPDAGTSKNGAAQAASGAARVDLALLPRLTGVPLLDQLALLPRNDLARFIAEKPSALKQLVADPPSARDVSAWWASAPPAGRRSLVATAPTLVGNLSGVPFDVRNSANRDSLKQSIGEMKASMKGLGRGEIVSARLQLQMLEKVRAALKPSRDGQPKSLLTFDATQSGRAAIAVGDVSTADYVSYLVPGMFFSVDTALNTWTRVATELNDEQSKWVSVLAASDPTMKGKTVATVAWIGYQTPGITGVTSLALADQGAELIGHAIDGVQAVRAGSEPFVTVIGHSYGSTAAMIELAKGGMHVDALALIGSPGSAAQSASELGVPNGNVFVGEAAWDPVVNSAFYGSDPGSGAFGANRMSVAGGVDPITHHALTASAGHLGYFEPGSESMRNLALIGLNRGSLVTQGTTMDASRTLD